MECKEVTHERMIEIFHQSERDFIDAIGLLHDKNDAAKVQIGMLEIENETLRAENDRLKLENTEMKAKNERVMNQIMDLVKINL